MNNNIFLPARFWLPSNTSGKAISSGKNNVLQLFICGTAFRLKNRIAGR